MFRKRLFGFNFYKFYRFYQQEFILYCEIKIMHWGKIVYE